MKLGLLPRYAGLALGHLIKKDGQLLEQALHFLGVEAVVEAAHVALAA